MMLWVAPVFSADSAWQSVRRIPVGARVAIEMFDDTFNREKVVAVFVYATDQAIAVQLNSGQRSIPRVYIRRVRVADPSRRLRNGLIGAAIGTGVGFALGTAGCPSCANEGARWKFLGPLTAVGAGSGAALGLLPPPYGTIYRSK